LPTDFAHFFNKTDKSLAFNLAILRIIGIVTK